MKLQVAKWGNSLAVRLPAEYALAASLREGDCVDAEVTPAGKITLTSANPFDKAAFLARTRKRRAAMPLTEPVVENMRKEARY
ncbi:MAG: AbrB/MazE/SpoVT family DNA-binding domain-containing protein [Proteobacteria bacterium]|nr:AbrB/MazE/SpoVT family DNA-binding domain-containing protein [Pseudomonadota bacterium]